VGEIASAELEAMHHNLNLLERRTLIGALISSLPATSSDAGGSNGQAAAGAGSPATPNVPMTAQAAQAAVQTAAANALANPGQVKTMSTKGADASSTASRQSVEEAKLKIQPLVVDRIDIGAAARLERDELGRQIGELVGEILREERLRLDLREQKDLVELLLDDMLGLGPLEPLLAEETITDIMVNGPYQVYVERKGKLELTDVKFRDNQHVLNICSRIVSQVGRRVDDRSPLRRAPLTAAASTSSSRRSPSTVPGISIRKFSKKGSRSTSWPSSGTSPRTWPRC
jgi:pilus assembly protein CpaF